MALSREILITLIALQEKDSALDRLRAEMAKIPVAVKALRDALAAEKVLLDTVKGKIADFEKRKKERELELASKEEVVRKHQKELNQIKTNEAFKALQSEIDYAKAEGNAIETHILEAMEGLDTCRVEDKKVQAELKALESRAGSEIGVFESQLKALEARHAAQKAVRDEAATGVASEVLKIYDHIRSRGKPDAVVSINDGSCGACRMRIAPHLIVEAQKLKAMVYCESCQRILYRPEALVARPKDDGTVPISETAGGPLPEAEGRVSSQAQGEELPNSTERGAC